MSIVNNCYNHVFCKDCKHLLIEHVDMENYSDEVWKCLASRENLVNLVDGKEECIISDCKEARGYEGVCGYAGEKFEKEVRI